LRTVKYYVLHDRCKDPFLLFKIEETSSCALLRKEDSEEGETSRPGSKGEEDGGSALRVALRCNSASYIYFANEDFEG
jgi:hypothetical protein